MMHRPPPKTDRSTQDQVFWLAATALVLGQLLAFWMVCTQQVRNAQARHAASQAERLAVADCLRTVPHATLISCAARIAPMDPQAQALAAAAASDENPPENTASR